MTPFSAPRSRQGLIRQYFTQRCSRFSGVATVAVFIAVCAAGHVVAQGVPSGYQEYFVLGRAQNVWDMMDKVVTGEGAASRPDGISSLVTATANADAQIVFYDQWEDGFEADIFNPTQASTLVLGDGDPTNGDACDFTPDPTCVGDILHRGDYVNLASNAGLGAGCTVASVDPVTFTNLCSSVPVNLRCATAGACTNDEVRFDGGDLIRSTGGPLSVVHSQNPMSQFLGGSTEILPREAVENAFAYSIPVGEDSYSVGTLTEPFKYVDLNIVAYEDNTSILVTSPGAGSVSFVLGRGQHWTSLGSIDDGATDPNITITINAGTKISTSGPISGFMFTGASGTFATRHFALVPDVLHSTDYITTADGDDSAVIVGSTPDRPAAIYIFNPHIGFPLDVVVTDSTGTTTVTVPSNSTVARPIPDFSTIRMTSTQTFWGITAYDYSTPASDWGHSWLATRYLTKSYTVSYAPGDYNVPPIANFNAVYISPILDTTRILIDFDNDGLFDEVDLNGDGILDPGAVDPACDPATPACLYTYNTLSAMPVFDPSDFDNTGTRILTNKPVAVAWGQETDVTDGTEAAHDTGYTVYPSLFLDPVMEIGKAADPTHIPTAGGLVDYTLTITSGDFSGSVPLSNLQVYDLLPPGVVGSDYVTGSTVITYPNLLQDTTDPTMTEDPPGSGRWRLDWSFSPDTLEANRALTVSYQINIPGSPGATPRTLRNEGRASAVLGGSRFEPFDMASVSQSDVTIDKTVNIPTARIGEVLTYSITVNNSASTAETNVSVTDPIPSGTTFCDSTTPPAGTCNDPSGTGIFDPSQNAVVWSIASLPVGGPYTFSFDVIVNTGAVDGTEIDNSSGYESDQTPYFTSNVVSTQILSPELTAVKIGPPGPLHPNEIATFEIIVSNSSVVSATGILVIDPFQANTSYIPESMEWRRNTDPYNVLTDAPGDDEGEVNTATTPDQLELRTLDIPGGEDISFRFKVRINPGTNGLFASNQATVESDQTALINTNLVQIPIVGDADVIGHLFVDLDGNGVQDAGEPDMANVDVIITDSSGNQQTVTTDISGNYLVTVEAGATTLDVDENDPDFPPGALLTTANDPQTVTAVSGTATPGTPVGYQPRAFTMTKVSDATAQQILPGQIVHYTISATNESSLTQTTVTVTDPVPTGMIIVPGSTQVTYGSPVFRVTEYFIPNTSFSGLTFNLNLDQDLVQNYFAIVQGSDGDGSSNNNRAPDENYAAVTGDPFGTGELSTTGTTNTLSLTRHNSVDGWQGVVTVVECLQDCSTAGFVLRDVRRADHLGASTSGAVTTVNPWNDINQVMLLGGFNGAGCDTPETDNTATKVCHVRIFPSDPDQVNWTRDATAVTLTDATSTVMVLEWGAEWTIQRQRIQGNSGADGANTAAAYDTAPINPVNRADTWVWGTGHTNDQGLGDAGEGVLITLGDGVVQNSIENLLAIGIEYPANAMDFEVYALTHPNLGSNYFFKADGDTAQIIVDVPTAAAGRERMALVTNGCNGNGSAYPRPMFAARYLNDTTIRLERRRSGQDFPAWVQGLDFTDISVSTTFAGGDPPTLLGAGAGLDLGPGETVTISFDLQVDPNIATAITQITNTATLNTDLDGPFTASVTDNVVRPAVTVEPNNGNFVVFDAVNPQTRTYSHVVTNSGNTTDSFSISAMSAQGLANPGAGWIVELIDPSTGIVIATDTDFTDGTWDGGLTVNTGSMAPGATLAYDIRVTVPAGTAIGTAESTTLTATSNSFPGISAFATDETTVADQLGPIVLVSDQSGIVSAGNDVIYSHTVFNNSGITDTFDLSAYPTEPGWTATVYNDSNGDGVYTPGIDVEISNTLPLADGEHQLFFVKVTAPAGAVAGDTDVTYVTAVSRNDTSVFDGVSDTTTIDPASTHDLSGGGTLLVNAGDDCITPNGCPSFPGTLKSLGTTTEIFDFSLTASRFFGLDGLNHPTQLWIDTDGDGVVDLEIAEDLDGDGVWDTIAPGYDTNSDGLPDVSVPGGDTLAYELRRPVDALQAAYRDPVTLTATSRTTGEPDSITATNLLDAPTFAMITKFQPALSGSTVVIEWQTGQEIGTAGFRIERRQPGQALRTLHRGILPAVGNSPAGGTYRFVDSGAVFGKPATYVLWEIEIDGTAHILSVADVMIDEGNLPTDTRSLPANGYSLEEHKPALGRVQTTDDPPAAPGRAPGEIVSRLRIRFQDEGLHRVDATAIADGLGQPLTTIQSWIASGRLVLHTGDPGELQICQADPLLPGQVFADGFENGNFCAWSLPDDSSIGNTIGWLAAPDNNGLYFYGMAVDSIYTDDMIYWLEYGAGVRMPSSGTGTGTPVEGRTFSWTETFEEEGPYPLTSVITDPDSDFWFWDYVNVNSEYNYSKDTISVQFDTPAKSGEGVNASMTVFLQAESSDSSIPLDHTVTVLLNGTPIGAGAWDGSTAYRLPLSFSQNLLIDGTNTLEIKAPATSGIVSEIFYLDSFDITYRRYYRAENDRLVSRSEGRPTLTAEGFTTDDLTVFDISDPMHPSVVQYSSSSAGTGGIGVTFDTFGGETFLIQPLNLAMTSTVEVDHPSSLRSTSNRANYLLIAGAGLEDQAERLADYRRSTGFDAEVIRLQDIYDEFSLGVIDPMAIRDFLAMALSDWSLPPAYVVLIGDSSFDFKDRMGYGGNILPSPMVSTPDGILPSDHRLADIVGADGVPEISVGRIPARTSAQLATYIAKVRAFESSTEPWTTRTTWVADGVDEGGEFIDDTESLISLAPAGLRTDRIYVDTLGQDEARTALLNSINEGTLLIHFLGHANMQQMGDGPGLLRSADVANLFNGDRQPILTALTCTLGRFDRVVFDTIGESLLLQEGGGTTAIWAPTGLSFNRDGTDLSSVFTPATLNGTRLGDAVRQALMNYLRTSEDPQAHMPFLYTLLGDPAIRITH